jgi:3-oxoadipate enol-lactonase
MQWIEANGASLRYELTGGGPKTPLVLVHELGGSLESWDPTLHAFAAGRRVLRFDWRGAGLSERVRGTLALETMLADIRALMDRVGLAQPCDMIGSALGAGIAIGFAIRHPDRLRRLIACNPATGGAGPARDGLLARAEGVERDGMRAFAETSLARSYPERLRGDGDRFTWYRLRWIANDPGSFAAHNRMLAGMDLAPDFGRVRAKTLVLAGEHDGLRPPAAVKAIAEAIPGAEYRNVDSGHFMAVQTPELFLSHALPFLDAPSLK